MRVTSFVLPAALLHAVLAFDQSKFRLCDQGSFCRRYRKYISRVEKSGGSELAHKFDAASVRHSGNKVSAKVSFIGDPSGKPLQLDLKFFRDAAQGKCGIARATLTETDPLHRRFQLREGDVIIEESSLAVDNVAMELEEGATLFTSSAPGGCKLRVKHMPFELHYEANGKLLQKLNGRHLLNFERYRQKDAATYSALVDATSEDTRDLWEESFGGHSDSKPKGPAAVGVDVTFESATTIVGASEHATDLHLNENGFEEPYRFYNGDVFEYAVDNPASIYGSIPMVTAVHRWQDSSASTTSGFFLCNPSEGFLKVDGPQKAGWFSGAPGGEPTKTWWLFESGVLDAFFFAGPTPHNVLEQYHTVTGFPRMPPLTVLGKHQSRWNYVDTEDSLTVNKKFDQHDIPYDVLWLDIDHTDGKKYFTWHPTHFSKPEVLLDALNASRRKLVTIVDPHIKRETGYQVFEQLKDKDFMTKTKSGAQYDGWCWPGTSYYPDFCNPDMRHKWADFFSLDFYKGSRKDLYTWNDMNEPSVFNGPEVSMPRDNKHKCHWDTWDIEHRDVHNVYGYYHHGATVQGQLQRAPDVRPFVLTRSFFAGSHRHGAMWTGDNMAKWNHLQKSVPMLQTLCLNGYSFSGADVPGFFFNPELELFRRWHQLGIWYPFYRGHAHLETKRREPWTQGEDTTAMMREQVSARYQLMPMWYTLFAEWAFRGLPILRPLWWSNLDEQKAFDHVNTHMAVGDAIIVRAVTDASMTRAETYLTSGTWFDYWDEKAAPLQGGQSHNIQLHRNHIPAFVRAGHILCKRLRRRRSTGAMMGDPYTIVVYGGEKASGRLYVDDGESHAYERGSFIYEQLDFDGTTLSERPAMEWLAIGKSQGADLPQRSLRIERVVFVGLKSKPAGAKISVAGETGSLEITSEQAQGNAWLATVKKPTALLGQQWSLELEF